MKIDVSVNYFDIDNFLRRQRLSRVVKLYAMGVSRVYINQVTLVCTLFCILTLLTVIDNYEKCFIKSV